MNIGPVSWSSGSCPDGGLDELGPLFPDFTLLFVDTEAWPVGQAW